MRPDERHAPNDNGRGAARRLDEAREYERAGRLGDAAVAYETAIGLADMSSQSNVLCEALRRLAVVRHRRQEDEAAATLSHRACAVARDVGDKRLAAEALNTRASIDLDRGRIAEARHGYHEALDLASAHADLRGRIRQNLGIIANIEGDFATAQLHYTESLAAYRADGDVNGCGIAYHNLGMVSADRAMWDDADRFFRHAMALADAHGDQQLRAHCLLSHTEVFLARRDFNRARENAEEALLILDALGAQRYKADAYIVLGIVFRETGRHGLAEARLRRAIELASSAHAAVTEAEASRELAELYRQIGRNQEALRLLRTACLLFSRVAARVDLADVQKKVTELEVSYPPVGRE